MLTSFSGKVSDFLAHIIILDYYLGKVRVSTANYLQEGKRRNG